MLKYNVQDDCCLTGAYDALKTQYEACYNSAPSADCQISVYKVLLFRFADGTSLTHNCGETSTCWDSGVCGANIP